MTEPTFTITAREFRDLVTPVIPLACKDRMTPILNAVRIESVGKYLTASATDRFTVGICRHAPANKPPKGLAIVIPLPSIRLILSTFKPSRDMDPELEFAVTAGGKRLKVNQAGGAFDFLDASITYPLETGQWPALPKVIIDRIESEDVPATTISLNAAHLAKFQHAVRHGEPLEIKVGCNNKAVLVTVGDHFVGALMPTSRSSDNESGTSTLAEWVKLFASASVPAKSKAA